MKEQEIQSKIIKYIQASGGYVVKVITASKAGVPDIIACIDGKFYGFEVKTVKGKPSPLQLTNIAMIEAAGGVGAVVRSAAEVMEILAKHESQ